MRVYKDIDLNQNSIRVLKNIHKMLLVPHHTHLHIARDYRMEHSEDTEVNILKLIQEIWAQNLKAAGIGSSDRYLNSDIGPNKPRSVYLCIFSKHTISLIVHSSRCIKKRI